jgi:hypothetical protein
VAADAHAAAAAAVSSDETPITATASEPAAPPAWEPPPITPEVAARNAALVARLKGKLILAPLTRGGHLAFRRLCADFGAEVTVSEMAFARGLVK